MPLAKHSKRGLSKSEKAAIPHTIAAGIDLEKIEIHNRKWTLLTPPNVSVVRGNKIFYPNEPGHCSGVYHLAHLVHEVVHVWQYNYLGVGLYSPRWLDRRYHYNLHKGDMFLDFGLEQQASIVEDLFRLENGLPTYRALNAPSWSRFKRYIDSNYAATEGPYYFELMISAINSPHFLIHNCMKISDCGISVAELILP